MRIEFTVHGIPQPQGSTRAFVNKHTGRAAITSDNTKLKPWRQDVAMMAFAEMGKRHSPVSTDAVEVSCYFYFQKPRSAKKSVIRKVTKPDIDKLLRGVLDSLTGIVFRDDAQVVGVQCYKLFAETSGARIIVQEL